MIMNTDNLDKHTKDNLATYESFMTASKYVIGAVILTLVLMAIFLL